MAEPGDVDRELTARPRNSQFADPAAAAVFAAVRTLPVAAQWDVLRAVQEMLAAPGRDRDTQRTRTAAAVRALREAAALADGTSLSLNEYEGLRADNPDQDWPAPRVVKRWLGVGSWNEALEAAHLVRDSAGDSIVASLGPAFSAEEAKAALRMCAEELGHVPSYNEYIQWTHRKDVRRRPGRRPMSQIVFTRLFGTFLKALSEAGLLDADGAAAAAPDGMIRSAGYWISDDRMRESLREVAARIGRSPRTQEYIAERSRIFEETSAAGAPRALVAYGTINRRFGKWDDALAAAGLEPLGGRHSPRMSADRRMRKGTRIDDQTFRNALLEAYSALGEPFTQPAYTRWRKEVIRQCPRRKNELPSYHSFWKRYGNWEAAVLDALSEGSTDVG
jgi:Homing endonuclease associated repeat